MILANVILITTLLFIAATIVRDLYKATERGRLRSIMIAYFSTEIIMLAGLLTLEWIWGDKILLVTQYIVFITLLPKVVVKIIFYNYIN